MPTYEYACAACGHQWDEVQRITAPPLEVCPKCAASSAHRLISGGTNFILKGGGWYSDLYSSPKSTAKKPEEGAGGTEKAEKTETKAEAKATGDGGSSSPSAASPTPPTAASS
jgi:putative FmdB family regulatory protein